MHRLGAGAEVIVLAKFLAHKRRNSIYVTVLKELTDNYNDDTDFFYLNFNNLMPSLNITRTQAKRACRYLKRKGLAQFRIGLWTDDGEPAGAGYAATPLGAAVYAVMQAFAEDENGSTKQV